ncbi:MAG TPA: type II toxin-antitoxin system VapC family toxin [Candidatus Margulisiibacteriota bacterium]|nr:type II toxin-antitoxin system VapC family toxin [Candidatus Margulisiibacteriota bacterium]
MSRYLIDTNILVRLVSPRDPLKPVALTAVDQLRRQQDQLSIAPQTLMEFWAVATRPPENNGLGLAPTAAAQEVDRFAENFPLVPEPPALYPRWRQLAQAHAVRGRQVFDARLAAIMIEAGIDHILTFNADDFRRYPGITPVSPHALTAPTAPEPGTD